MKTWEERREERRKYENDVFYDVWRSGKNPDNISYDRVDSSYYNGYSAEEAARAEINAQSRQEQAALERRWEEERQMQESEEAYRQQLEQEEEQNNEMDQENQTAA